MSSDEVGVWSHYPG